MAKTIINKCPNCGEWCEAEAKGLLGKLARGWNDTVEGASEIGKKYLGGLGEWTGSQIGTYIGVPNAVRELVTGHKYQFVCPKCGAKWSTDYESDDERPQYELWREVLELLEGFGKATLGGKQQMEDYTRKVQAKLSDNRNFEWTKVILNNMLAAAWHEQGENGKATSAVNEALAISQDYPLSLVMKGLTIGTGRNASDALSALNSLIHYKKLSTDEGIKLYTKAQYHDQFIVAQNRYTSDFLTIPSEQRRFLYLIVGNLDDKLNQLPETVRLLPITQLPTELEIIGTPQDNVLYICHPYKTNRYIPADAYQLELLRDELHEFCHIMECLGAKQISLSDTHTNQQGEAHNKSTNIKGGVSYNGYSGSASVGKQTSDSLDSMIQRELSERHEFLCSKKYPPYIPNDIVWYNHRQEWQRKVQSRMEGRLIKDKYTIATSASETITGAKKIAIEAEVNALGASLNVGYDGASDFTIKQSESYSQEVEVEFWPLDEYETSTQRQTVLTYSKIQEQRPKKTNWTVVALVGVIVVLAVILGVVLL